MKNIHGLKNKSILFIIFIFILSTLVACNKINNKNITNEQWEKDISFYEKALKEYHPNLYKNINQEKFQNQIDALIKDLPYLSDLDIKFRLAQITASIGDAHTIFYPVTNMSYIYPVKLEWFGNGLYVIKTDEQYKEILGKKILKINNIPINDVMNKINTTISHENTQWLKAINVQKVFIPEYLDYFGIVKGKKATFTFNGENGDFNIDIIPKAISKLKDVSLSEKLIDKSFSLKEKGLYSYHYDKDNKILYLQYNNCYDRSTFDVSGEYTKKYMKKVFGIDNENDLPDFETIIGDKIVQAFNSKKVNKFIIDLRYNHGGSALLLQKFIGRIKNEVPVENRKKVFFITGKNTFSAAVVNCYDLKNELNAISFGEPTGSKPNMYGTPYLFQLPNSKVTFSCSTQEMYSCNNDSIKYFMPDHVVEQKYEDYVRGIDIVYESIKNLY